MIKNMFLFVGRFVLEFNHSAPQEALSSQLHGFNYYTVMPEPGGPGGHWHPQYLADQLTLFQPGEGRSSHLLPL